MPLKDETSHQQSRPLELATFCEVFACSVAYSWPQNPAERPSNIPLVHCFGAMIPEFECILEA